MNEHGQNDGNIPEYRVTKRIWLTILKVDKKIAGIIPRDYHTALVNISLIMQTAVKTLPLTSTPRVLGSNPGGGIQQKCIITIS